MTQPRRDWQIWSKDPSRDAWQVIEPTLTEEEARAGVERRNRFAAKHEVEVEFMALPRDETPHSATSGKTE